MLPVVLKTSKTNDGDMDIMILSYASYNICSITMHYGISDYFFNFKKENCMRFQKIKGI